MTLEISNLTKIFGTQRAVDSISFTAQRGEILGFLGPNGAGKSTTMKMITSYLKQEEGSIKVLGMDTVKESLSTRSHIGYLPEHNPLYLEMYVKEYLGFVCEVHGIKNKKQRISELIDMVGLGKEAHKHIGSLSKGYRQRVGLAQALCHDPDILILDEPTSGLDMNQLQDIRQLIKGLGKEKTVIFSTHIMQEVQALCDRVIIINNGKLVADDPIDKLADKITGRQQIILEIDPLVTSALNFGQVEGIENVSQEGHQYTLSYQKGVDPRVDIFRYCAQKDAPIIAMKKLDVNMEDVFQQLTLR